MCTLLVWGFGQGPNTYFIGYWIRWVTRKKHATSMKTMITYIIKFSIIPIITSIALYETVLKNIVSVSYISSKFSTVIAINFSAPHVIIFDAAYDRNPFLCLGSLWSLKSISRLTKKTSCHSFQPNGSTVNFLLLQDIQYLWCCAWEVTQRIPCRKKCVP